MAAELGEHELIAIEVKHTKNPGPNDVKGLRIFRQDYPMAKCMLLYTGEYRIMQNDILCVPIRDFFG